MKKNKGLLFNIQRGSIHDGPGLRTVLFFKGCPLDCIWCHNPESKSHKVEYVITSKQGDQEEKEKIGDYYTPNQALIEIEKDLSFYNETGGGVTFSGGEPTLQPKFLSEIVHICKMKKIHTTLQTCGFFTYDTLIQTLLDIDLILFDLKIIDSESHKKLTGKTNQTILGNLKKLYLEHKNVYTRYVSVPEQNSTEKHLGQLADFLQQLNINDISILKYNPLYFDKIKKLGKPKPNIKEYQFEEVESCWNNTIEIMKKKGFQINAK